jgi:hypothetical protein
MGFEMGDLKQKVPRGIFWRLRCVGKLIVVRFEMENAAII